MHSADLIAIYQVLIFRRITFVSEAAVYNGIPCLQIMLVT
jgi:hypothetical protein